jgi:acyl carrier protein
VRCEGRINAVRPAGPTVSAAMTSTVMSVTTDQTADEAHLAQTIVDALNLEMQPGEIEPEAPLYRDGLGLDSIDILELALVVSKTSGLQLRADDEDKVRIFESRHSLSKDVRQHRTM